MQNLGKKWFAFSKMDVESGEFAYQANSPVLIFWGGLRQKRYLINSYGLDNKTVVSRDDTKSDVVSLALLHLKPRQPTHIPLLHTLRLTTVQQ